MNKITLNNIRVYTNHGCLTEEKKIGSDYRVDLSVYGDLSTSAESDELSDTIDYVHLNAIVKDEMAIRSKLLEHVAQRILNRIFKELDLVQKATVAVAKLNPPLGGDVASVSVELTNSRN